MSKSGTIIIVDDNKGVLTAVQILLKSYFSKIVTLSSPVTLSSVIREETPEVILLDMNFTSGINTGNEGLFWLHEIKKVRPELPVVLFTAYADIELAIRGIKEGATDFIVKPWNNQKLVETLQTAAASTHNDKKTDNKEETTHSPMYWGESKVMQQLRSLIEKVAITDANILITGENGTGKEMLAREIHLLSNRKYKEMIAVDMGTITESLFESELFGHVKGSFTDAHADRTGKFEAADNSTLFLDEIGNLPYHLQAKLPNLTLNQPRKPLGKYGRLRRTYLMQYRPVLYNSMLLNGTLYPHLMELEQTAESRMQQTMEQLLKQTPAPDKAQNQLMWVQHMNSLKAQAEELVMTELIYS